MLSNEEFVRQSLELNLFFMRITKEHAIFIETAFIPKDQSFAHEVENLKCEFTSLLAETIILADGVIRPEVLTSGELVTKYTADAERATEYYTGIMIDPEITRMEQCLGQNNCSVVASLLVDQVSVINQKAITSAAVMANYLARLLKEISNCKIFTNIYPLLIDHILREVRLYLTILYRLQNRQISNIVKDIIEQERFWDDNMLEHTKVLRGLLDPTEVGLFDTTNKLAKEFGELTRKAKTITEQTTILPQLSRKTYKATVGLRDFNIASTEGLLKCTIKAIAVPLFSDHLVRETNHYLRLLNTFIGRLR